MMNKSDEPLSGNSIAQSRGAGDLQKIIADATNQERGLPPVEHWNPPFCGDIDMEVQADGTWFYMGTPIGRAPLVRLFSTILRKDENGKTYLVTPVEKVGIRVSDAPFLAVEMVVTGAGEEQVFKLRTNVGDVVRVDRDHRLRFEIEASTGGLKPYVLVRGRLEALFSRALMVDLVALGEDVEIEGVNWFSVRSAGTIFPIIESAKLAELSV